MSLLKYLPEKLKEQIRRRAGVVTEWARLENLFKCGFNPEKIIDAGGYRGTWTVQILELLPQSSVLLIEPQATYAPTLNALCHGGRVQWIRKAVGETPGMARFILEEANSRLAPEGIDRPTVEVEVARLEEVARAAGFEDAALIKIDVQGNELAVLKGAGKLAGAAEVFQIEVSWIPIGNPPLALDVIQHMDAAGYRLYDIWGHNYRPRDGALWQTDFLFVRKNSKLVESCDWL